MFPELVLRFAVTGDPADVVELPAAACCCPLSDDDGGDGALLPSKRWLETTGALLKTADTAEAFANGLPESTSVAELLGCMPPFMRDGGRSGTEGLAPRLPRDCTNADDAKVRSSNADGDDASTDNLTNG